MPIRRIKCTKQATTLCLSRVNLSGDNFQGIKKKKREAAADKTQHTSSDLQNPRNTSENTYQPFSAITHLKQLPVCTNSPVAQSKPLQLVSGRRGRLCSLYSSCYQSSLCFTGISPLRFFSVLSSRLKKCVTLEDQLHPVHPTDHHVLLPPLLKGVTLSQYSFYTQLFNNHQHVRAFFISATQRVSMIVALNGSTH